MSKKMVNVATQKMVDLYQSCIGKSIRRLQKRLAKKATREPDHRFDDKYKCKHCGTRITLGVDAHCHHIDGDNSNHNLSNLATLCMTCHYLTYGKEHELNL